MLVSVLIGLCIFGYAGWTIVAFVKKSKQGKCAACSLHKSCSSSCGDRSTVAEFNVKKS